MKHGVISLVLCISTCFRLVTILSLLVKYLVILHADPCNKSYVHASCCCLVLQMEITRHLYIWYVCHLKSRHVLYQLETMSRYILLRTCSVTLVLQAVCQQSRPLSLYTLTSLIRTPWDQRLPVSGKCP